MLLFVCCQGLPVHESLQPVRYSVLLPARCRKGLLQQCGGANGLLDTLRACPTGGVLSRFAVIGLVAVCGDWVIMVKYSWMRFAVNRWLRLL